MNNLALFCYGKTAFALNGDAPKAAQPNGEENIVNQLKIFSLEPNIAILKSLFFTHRSVCFEFY